MRIDNPEKIDESAIRSGVTAGKVVTVQFSEKRYSQASLAALNRLCEELGENLCIRFYGHYGDKFDCNNLEHLSSVKNLHLNCLQTVENFDALKKLCHLSRLNIGIFDLAEKDFLSWPNLRQIWELCIAESQRNNFDLQYLSAYSNITKLFLSGHSKNIEALGDLARIEELSLSIPSKASIKFLNRLPVLKKLRFILGGRENLDDIDNYGIEELEIVRVKGFSGIENLGKFKRLRKLLIEDQIQLNTIDFGSDLDSLVDVRLINCKSLSSVLGISSLTSLNQIRIYKTAIDFDDFIRQRMPESLEVLAFYTAKKSKDTEIKRQLVSLGFKDGLPP